MKALPLPLRTAGREVQADVPCAGCTACCRGEAVCLQPGEDASQYETEEIDHPLVGRVTVLKRKPDGSCCYLSGEGCTIYDRRPALCRAFDCRRFFLQHSRVDRRIGVKKGLLSAEVLEAGRARLASLPGTRLRTLKAGWA